MANNLSVAAHERSLLVALFFLCLYPLGRDCVQQYIFLDMSLCHQPYQIIHVSTGILSGALSRGILPDSPRIFSRGYGGGVLSCHHIWHGPNLTINSDPLFIP